MKKPYRERIRCALIAANRAIKNMKHLFFMKCASGSCPGKW